MKTMYCNAAVYTGSLPLQEAFVVEDETFLFAGSRAQAEALSPEQVVDLKGGFVCPGFNDSHMHLLNYGQALSVAPLHRHTDSVAAMVACLQQTAPGRGGWILGRGWNQDFFRDVQRMPNRYDLDRVSTCHPVCAIRACGHGLCLNSKALDLLGIHGPVEIPGGEVVTENGIPTGMLYDNAMDLVYAAIPAPTKADVKAMLRSACQALNAQGITSCHSDDYCVFQNLDWQVIHEAYRELEEAGQLTVKVWEQANFPSVENLRAYIDKGNITGAGSGRFRIGPLKLLGDGALGARTALLSRPYADAPDTAGLSVFTQAQMDALVDCAHRAGMQVAVHTIGDGCLDMVLDALEKAMTAHPRQDHRHGIVHCQITRPDQLERIARLKLHVYAQSIFLDYDLHIVTQRAGPELAATSYSWKTLMDLGATVSNGSDCPVELPRVLAGIQCAVTRRDLAGNGPYLPAQAFTLPQALDSFTRWGAYASFEENRKGQIAPGMAADFTVLGENPFRTPPETWQDIPVLATYLDGEAVYRL